MAIKKDELDAMNNLVKNGLTISDISKNFPEYDYWEIYWELNDASFLGKKRTITNRINKLVSAKSKSNREEIADEAKELLDELYISLKKNSKKLIEIDRILRK
ncbi:MAG: hypothetical protein KUA37_11965 [Desulfomicrobium sp.]|jgi:(p)ppGpp synthase/HD superfamily hydrolase|nr:hypothetical protein [Desulfomicrobium sp.]MBV1719429.1 hypothetical protein [Desulfomicrobium sp.]MBV1746533.1 hypothetical protein [Desulfomicrobium sp.]